MIFCDVDGTLSEDGTRKWAPPRHDVMEVLSAAIAAGHEVILWSAQGEDYCRAWARRYHLGPHACISKPDLAVDDRPLLRGENRLTVIPPEELKDFLVKHNGP